MKKCMLLIVLISVSLCAAFGDEILPSYCDGDTCFIDPATLQVGTTVPPLAGDPNVFHSKTFLVYQNQGGATNLKDGWLLILGVPNTTAANPFGLGITGLTASGGGTALDTYLGLKGTMGPGQEAYSRLGVQGPTDNSNNFVNWSGADLADAGVTATSFGLYEFAIYAHLAGKQYVDFTFDHLPNGTIAIAYGQTASTITTTDKKGKTHTTVNVLVYDTPFTEAGLYTSGSPHSPTPVPEPGSLLLLGSGLAGLGRVWKLRK